MLLKRAIVILPVCNLTSANAFNFVTSKILSFGRVEVPFMSVIASAANVDQDQAEQNVPCDLGSTLSPLFKYIYSSIKTGTK